MITPCWLSYFNGGNLLLYEEIQHWWCQTMLPASQQGERGKCQLENCGRIQIYDWYMLGICSSWLLVQEWALQKKSRNHEEDHREGTNGYNAV